MPHGHMDACWSLVALLWHFHAEHVTGKTNGIKQIIWSSLASRKCKFSARVSGNTRGSRSSCADTPFRVFTAIRFHHHLPPGTGKLARGVATYSTGFTGHCGTCYCHCVWILCRPSKRGYISWVYIVMTNFFFYLEEIYATWFRIHVQRYILYADWFLVCIILKMGFILFYPLSHDTLTYITFSVFPIHLVSLCIQGI